ncbi:hypothetical protein AB0C65_21625 [Nocardia sp. NPDC048505]
MGAYSTTPLGAESAAAEPAATAPSPPPAPKPPRSLRTTLSRTFAWLFFVGGVVGAVLGIAGLHVEITVAGLILACTAGLVLLKLRHDRGAQAETD